MKYNEYDSELKIKKFNDLFSEYRIYLLENCLENPRAKNFDSDWFKQEFYDSIEELVLGIKCADGY